MTNKECEKKRQEKCFVEQAMKACPSLFPSGELIKCKGPDFLLKTDSETIGIEVTRIFQQKGGKFTPRSYDGDVEKVVCCAKKRYYEMGGVPVNVRVYPTTFDDREIDKKRMVESLACFVKKHYRAGQTLNFSQWRGITANSSKQCDILTCETCNGRCIEIPEDFAEGSMFPPSGHLQSGKWWVGSGSVNVPQLSYKDVESTIKKKNDEKLPSYRTSVNCVWLLIVLDLLSPPAFLQVPRSAETWKFSFKFNKVLLFSHEDGVIEFGRCP